MPLPLLAMLAGMGQGAEQSKDKELERQKLQAGLTLLEQQVKDSKRKHDLIESLLGIGGTSAPQNPAPMDMSGVTEMPNMATGMPAIDIPKPKGLPSAPPQLGGPQNGGQNKIFQIVKGAMDGDPNAIAQVEAMKMAGIDLGPAIGVMQKNRENTLNQQKYEAGNIEVITEMDPATGNEIQYFRNKVTQKKEGQPWLRKQADIESAEIMNQDGSKSKRFFRKTPQGLIEVPIGPSAQQGAPPTLGGPQGGPSGGPGMQTAPGPMDMPITAADDLQKWKNEAGEIPSPGMTPKQLQQQGFKIVEKEKTADIAGKIATTEAAIKSFETYKDLIIDKKTGKLNTKNVLAMNAPGGGLPWSEGRYAYSLFKEGIDAKIRAMTGAAITKEEEPFYNGMFLPSPFDDEKTALSKVQRYEGFLKSYLSELKPSTKLKEGEYTIKAGGKTMVVSSPEEKDLPAADKIYVKQIQKMLDAGVLTIDALTPNQMKFKQYLRQKK